MLTEQYLILTPWDMTETRKWLFAFLAKAGAPSYVGKIDELITKSKLLDPVAIPLTEITRIATLSRASLLTPPTARLSLRSGATFDLGILAGPRSPNVNPANNQAFDDWLSQMHGALAGTRGSAPGLSSATTSPSQETPSAIEVTRALVGKWRLRGPQEATLQLNSDGALAGTVSIFGALPDGSPLSGSWWLAVGIPTVVAFQGQVREPRVDPEVPIPFVAPFNLTVGITQITPEKIMGEALDEQDAPVEFDRIG